jgi:hypothetical protein
MSSRVIPYLITFSLPHFLIIREYDVAKTQSFHDYFKVNIRARDIMEKKIEK